MPKRAFLNVTRGSGREFMSCAVIARELAAKYDTLYLAAFNAKDYSLLMTDMAFYTIIGLLASIVVDLSYGFIDPRIRMGAKK